MKVGRDTVLFQVLMQIHRESIHKSSIELCSRIGCRLAEIYHSHPKFSYERLSQDCSKKTFVYKWFPVSQMLYCFLKSFHSKTTSVLAKFPQTKWTLLKVGLSFRCTWASIEFALAGSAADSRKDNARTQPPKHFESGKQITKTEI